METRKCPKCGCEEFEILAVTHDTVSYLCNVEEDGSINTVQVLKEFVGDSDWANTAKCYGCGEIINIGDERFELDEMMKEDLLSCEEGYD